MPKPAEPNAAASPHNAITLPYIDWDAEAQAQARRKNAGEEAERLPRNLAALSDAQLQWWRNNAPLLPRHHQPGESERDAGEVITWENDRCFWTTHGITTFGMPSTSRVCKDPFKPNTEMFKDLRKKLEERDSPGTP